jgi:OOP family OmpA-OmpF porin
MAGKLVYTMIAVASLGLAGSFNGCTCNGEAQIGKAAPKAPEPPPPAPPPPPVVAAPPPAPPPAAAPAPRPVMAVGKAKIEGNKVKIPGELEFDIDKATLKETPQSKEILVTLVDFMKQNPQVTKLRVEGHTDNTGKPDHNQTLSQQRADAVVDYLSKQGIDKTRLVAVGFGQGKPLVDNDNAEHKAMNRRTEFHVAEIDGKAQESASTGTAGTGTAGTGTTGTGIAPASTVAGSAPALTNPSTPPKKEEKKEAPKTPTTEPKKK